MTLAPSRLQGQSATLCTNNHRDPKRHVLLGFQEGFFRGFFRTPLWLTPLSPSATHSLRPIRLTFTAPIELQRSAMRTHPPARRPAARIDDLWPEPFGKLRSGDLTVIGGKA